MLQVRKSKHKSKNVLIEDLYIWQKQSNEDDEDQEYVGEEGEEEEEYADEVCGEQEGDFVCSAKVLMFT